MFLEIIDLEEDDFKGVEGLSDEGVKQILGIIDELTVLDEPGVGADDEEAEPPPLEEDAEAAPPRMDEAPEAGPVGAAEPAPAGALDAPEEGEKEDDAEEPRGG